WSCTPPLEGRPQPIANIDNVEKQRLEKVALPFPRLRASPLELLIQAGVAYLQRVKNAAKLFQCLLDQAGLGSCIAPQPRQFHEYGSQIAGFVGPLRRGRNPFELMLIEAVQIGGKAREQVLLNGASRPTQCPRLFCRRRSAGLWPQLHACSCSPMTCRPRAG